MPDITLTAAERAALYFFPPADGGKVTPEAVQLKLQDMGLLTAPQADGRRYLTVLGDRVCRGVIPVKVDG